MPPALNDPQRRAVQHGAGPLLVLAGPGSGKTRVVTHRIARLLEKGVPATEILAVTFTNKAAKEMRERVRSLVREKAKGLTIATFHSACVRILREEIEPLGWSKNFSIYDESSQQSLLRAVLRDLAGGGSASAMLQEIGAVKSGLAPTRMPVRAQDLPDVETPTKLGAARATTPGPVAQEAARRLTLDRTMERYQQELRARNALDFDDIILLTARLFKELPDVLARWQARWKHVLVDEYQDTNASQDEILRLLCAEHRNLCVVGDDDQSIYGWRGAEIEHILTFQRRFPEAKIVKLEQNYRSTGRIVAVANGLIAKNAQRHAKTVFTESMPGDCVRLVELPDENEEADFIAAQVASEIPAGGNAWKDAARFAVLFRTNEQMRPLEQALRQNKVPYRLLGGRSFFDRKEVLDSLAYLRLTANPDDEEAFFRIANVPSRGLGAGALETLSATARAMSSNPWKVARLCASGDAAAAAGLSVKALAGISELVTAIDSTEHAAAMGSRTLVSDMLAKIRYQDEIDRSYKDPGVRVSRWNLALEVQKTWEAYLVDAAPVSLSGLLDAITLRARDDDDDEGGGVTLATIHASKGLEFPVVFVGGLEEGILPHSRSRDDGKALAEERRLLYVAITRARERLFLTRALSRTTRGRSSATIPSRFLEDLPEEAIEKGLSTAPASDERVSSHVARLRAMLGGESG